MTNLRYDSPFNLLAFGDRLWNDLPKTRPHSGFPFADVYVDNDKNQLVFELALAGYKKENLDISVKDNVLKIASKKIEKEENNFQYIEHRIAMREFERSWVLGPQINSSAQEATFENGILRIVFSLIEEDVKQIEIL